MLSSYNVIFLNSKLIIQHMFQQFTNKYNFIKSKTNPNMYKS